MADVNIADVKIEDLAACRAVMPALSNKGYFNYVIVGDLDGLQNESSRVRCLGDVAPLIKESNY